MDGQDQLNMRKNFVSQVSKWRLILGLRGKKSSYRMAEFPPKWA